MSNPEGARKYMHEAVERMIEIDPPGDEDGPAMIRSWLCIATLRYADGSNQMYLVTGDASGECLPKWDKEGLLHYGLYGWEPADE